MSMSTIQATGDILFTRRQYHHLLVYAVKVVAIVMYVLTVAAFALDNGLALTPPMGWNSWNYFACRNTFNETTIRQIADAMVSSGMKDLGYQYINLDDCWAEYYRDAKGGLVPNKTRFPNFKGMVEYIRSKGLKVGLYSDVGSETCAGAMPGSYGHEQQDADSLVAWGIEYLKYDFCGGRNGVMDAPTAYAKMRDCLAKAVADARARGNSQARPIVFSICEWGTNEPWKWGKQTGNLWRVFLDIEVNWGRIDEIIERSAGLWQYAGPGGWNDPDMLQVGNGMKENEDRVHFSLWCMLAAPLIAGNDLRNMSPATKSILTNKELIAVNQDSLGMQAKRIRNTNGIQVWVKKLRHDNYAVALYNYWANTSNITVTWAEIGAAFGENIPATKTFYVRDLWKHQDLGAISGSFTATAVPTQDIVVVRLSPTPFTAANSAIDNRSRPLGLTIQRMSKSVAIGMAEDKSFVVTIYDQAGKVVLKRQGCGSLLTLANNDVLRRGVWLLSLRTDAGSWNMRLAQ